MTNERQQYAPVSVRAPWSKTTERLHAKFGWPGVLAWQFMILAAKRSYVPGQLTFGGDADFWVLLGMESDPPEFAVDDLLRELGRMKQTSHTRSGRLSYVSLTRFGHWNENDKRWREAERKRRKRQESGPDTERTEAGHDADTERTPPGHVRAPSTRTKEVLKDPPSLLRGKAGTNGQTADDDVAFDLPTDLTRPMPR